jgi:hypothetical protein
VCNSSVPILLRWLCLRNALTSGVVQLYNDNTRALRAIFSSIIPNPLEQARPNMDLVTSRRKLLECIMVGVNHRWTRGHPTGEIIRDDSQSSFDHLAHTHNKIINIVNPFHEFHVPPDSQAELLNEGGLIHYEISRCVTEAIHTAPIHTKILRDTNWTHHQFALIDWEVHGQAFKVLARFRHMSICKLIYQLLPTNTL